MDKTLSHFQQDPTSSAAGMRTAKDASKDENRASTELPSIHSDVEQKKIAMDRIAKKLFVDDADRPEFQKAQKWISDCAGQVQLPINFCGGILIVRLCRRLIPVEQQTDDWSSAVQRLAAAYDFAFLALGHADDEADLTRERRGFPVRWTTHPQTRAVDGINLILAGITDAQIVLKEWPAMPTKYQPNNMRVLEELLRALREASFPILIDRSGLGYENVEAVGDRHRALEVSSASLHNVALYNRHRAHTYFLRAFRIATLATGYEEIDEGLEHLLERLFELLASIGAAADDLQDTFVDFSARTHSVVSIMAHLCVAEESSLRPQCRRTESVSEIHQQRKLLSNLWGAPSHQENRSRLLQLFEAVELKKALYQHYEPQCVKFANYMFKAVKEHGFSVELMSELVAYVCQDDEFSIPSQYIVMLESIDDEVLISLANAEIGKYIASYFLDRFYPSESEVC